MANRVCPACGWRIHHSHTRGLQERFVRAVTSYKMYRCRECGWRGWMGKASTPTGKHRLRTWLIVVLGLLLTLLMALYLVEKLSQPPTSGELSQSAGCVRPGRTVTAGGLPYRPEAKH